MRPVASGMCGRSAIGGGGLRAWTHSSICYVFGQNKSMRRCARARGVWGGGQQRAARSPGGIEIDEQRRRHLRALANDFALAWRRAREENKGAREEKQGFL
jgi:hypothetical protein